MANILEHKIELDETGSHSFNGVVGQAVCVVYDSEPTAEQKQTCKELGYGMEWSSGGGGKSSIQMQNLLNHYQYDRKAYMRACQSAGIDAKAAASFADEVYGYIRYSGVNSGDTGAWGWIFVAFFGLLGCAWILWKAIELLVIPQLPQCVGCF